MRRLLGVAWFTAAVVVAACGDNVGDDGVDAAAFIAPRDGLDGAWAITWACVSGCGIGVTNPLGYADRVDIAGEQLVYGSSVGCTECGATHDGRLVDGCLVVPADPPARSTYRLCQDERGIDATLEWRGHPGPTAPRRWRLHGVPR